MRAEDPSAGTSRWLAFFLCVLVSVVPVLAFVPSWVWLRYEGVTLLLVVLGVNDARGAEVLYQRYLDSILAPIDDALASVGRLDLESVLHALEAWAVPMVASRSVDSTPLLMLDRERKNVSEEKDDDEMQEEEEEDEGEHGSDASKASSTVVVDG